MQGHPLNPRRFNLRLRLLSLLLMTGLSACTGPSLIDEACIKGRLSDEQAAAVNKGPWQHLPSYNRDADGQCKDCAGAGDRILSSKCSQLVKETNPRNW